MICSFSKDVRCGTASPGSREGTYVESLVLDALGDMKIDEEEEYLRGLDTEAHSLPSLREVVRKGYRLCERSQGRASQASYKRSKEMLRAGQWCFSTSVK